MGYKILLPQEIMEEGREYLESRGYELIKGSGLEEEDIIRDIKGCDGIIVRLSKMSRKVFEAADKLKVVVRHGAGYDTVDLQAARDHNVMVCYAPVANSMSVAEAAMMYMLNCSRNFKKTQKHFIDDFYYAKLKLPRVEMDGKTLGLIGVGNIGSRVAKKALHGFNMKVIAYDPYKTQAEVPEGVQLIDDFDQIFKESDFVSLHCPANEETTGFVGTRELELMKPTAYLINTARGKLIKEDEFYEAMKNERIAGAALDVMMEEPPKADNPLLYLDNVTIGPHLGAATIEATDRASLHCAIGVDEVLSGKEVTWPIPEMKDFCKKKVTV
ncbi:hydroxyacid dehydrogenase [Enterococcus pallens]|uniref:Phosphoglycerate dehydrogenase n=1 Tax=Enterococcus pallens ATCC BAA-351 TaxID=1158607 RepID=R2QQJ3_9ENTE|nr:hydroxyacid dehydrogenase [Enterococcus pallens]EOH97473.1 phosphoglycerate dehydrogenase [Enterococcus pallens ATCC BAA-351]EOU21108.1 phosphoglycerate dehydrogenase [Enterococcus pallens ATCC BAA-351]OJG80687.1 phosphoglycerate dehydrogenase [Enterococcus pallens]